MVQRTAIRVTRGFRHEAVLYEGLAGMSDAVSPFIEEGLERNEPVLVAMLPDRIGALRTRLGDAAADVTFLDMATIGRNPARIIPAWREFVEAHRGRSAVRGVGEPVWEGRRPAEIQECLLHEALLNLAFDDGPEWRLICPYDADGLPEEVLHDAVRTHPVVSTGFPSSSPYAGPEDAFREFARELPTAPPIADTIDFSSGDLSGLRSVVRRLCTHAGLARDATDDLVLAAHELATNSIMHGGGAGVLRAWRDSEALVVEVRDLGVIADPLVGRGRGSDLAEGGRGVWMANQLCDLVQVRSSPAGTVVRLHAWL